MRSQKELMIEFYKLIFEYKYRVFFSMVLIVISTFCIIYAPKLAGQTVNYFLDGLKETDYEDVFNNLILLSGLYLAGYLLKLPASRTMIFVGEKITYKLRLKLYDGLTSAQLKNIYPNTSGNIMGSINNDLMNVRSYIIVYLSEYLAVMATLILTIILIISTDWDLSVIYLGLLPIFIIILYFFHFKSKHNFKNHQNEMGLLIGFMGDSIANHTAIYAYNCQDYIEEKFEGINRDVVKYYKSSRFSTGVIPPVARLLINLGNIGVYLYGVYLLINHQILLGTLLTVILYGQILTKPLLRVSSILTSMQTSFASLDRILEVIHSPPNKLHGSLKMDQNDVEGAIEFRNLCYGNIINDVNLKVNPGELVSITGHVGSTKSTLMELLIGLYEIDSGEILLDGCNIYKIDPTRYRSVFGYVPNEKWIFEGTIMENIGYGLDDYTFDDVKRVCELIGFDEIIETLPNKYDTMVLDGKNTLSSSEEAMICIARAMIRDPKILILDDAKVDVSDIIDGRTVFIVTDDEIIINMSDKVIEL